MPIGSRFYMTWEDFRFYMKDFEDFVADGIFDKMDYRMWRKLKYERSDNTQVILEKHGYGFVVIIGHEDEYHSFYGGDNSFGDFMLENFFEREEAYESYYDEGNPKWMPAKVDYMTPDGKVISEDTKVSVQCTSSNVYPKKDFKINFNDEMIKSAAIDCGEDLKASAKATKDRLLDCLAGTGIGVMAINTDPGPSVSCVIDTKVDKAEFDSKLEALSDKIQAVADKYNNIDKKENSTMKGFNFDFGPMNGNVVRMSIYGLAVKNKTGSWVAYDAKNEEIMDVDVFNFDGSKFMYRMPVAINDVAAGDVIVHMSVPMFVVGKSEDGKAVYAVDPVAGERKEIMLTKSPFGFNFVTKVVNFLGNAFNADASNPFGNLGLMMMLSEDSKGMGDMLPLMMLSGNVPMDSNMLMMLAMSNSDKMNEMLPFMLMMNANKPAVPHVCNCGHHNQ